VLHDLKQAIRLLARQPVFTLVACLTLALGIGANTAIFSVVDAALFQPLPYRNADRLVGVYRNAKTPDGRVVAALIDGGVADYVRAATSLFDGVEVFKRPGPRALASGAEQSPWVGGFSVGLPSFLGIAPELGRTFTADDVAAGEAIVLSDRYWRRAFNGDSAVLGRIMAFSDRTCTVIGVMPPTFRFFAGASADAWLPASDRDGDDLAARLRPGVTIAQATRELDAITTRMAGKSLDWFIEPAGSTRVGDSPRQMLLSLLGAVGFVLLIACANVANLLLARTLVRQRELAVRAALGATRWRLVRQFLVEGMVLGVLGGAAAIGLAWIVIRAVPAVMPGKLIQSLLAASLPSLDARVLAFGVGCALLTGVSCGLVPAVRAAGSVALSRFLAAGSRIAGPSRLERRVRASFQAVQVALTLVLLVGAGLLINSFLRLRMTPAGFDGERLSYATLAIPSGTFAGQPQTNAFAEELVTRVRALPGITAAAIGPPPAAGSISTEPMASDTEPPRVIRSRAQWFFIGEDYFRTAGIGLLAGRAFGTEDREGAPRVVIISERLARQLWPQQSAVGRRILLDKNLYSVIGVAPNLNTIYLADDDVQLFVPARQVGIASGLIVRSTNEVGATADAVRAVVRGIDPRVMLRRIGTVESLIDELDPLGSPRLYAVLMGALAALGLVTAAVGLFGLVSYAVSQRTREIGVRIALGADARSVRQLVVRSALGPIVTGLAAGLVASWWMSRLLATQLFHVTPHDPVTLAGIVLLVVVACGLAATVPVTRAGRVDPVEALRAD
jgi:predicted permease